MGKIAPLRRQMQSDKRPVGEKRGILYGQIRCLVSFDQVDEAP